MAEFYVTVEGDRVAGPFETRAEAKQWAADENTHEVGLSYQVESAN